MDLWILDRETAKPLMCVRGQVLIFGTHVYCIIDDVALTDWDSLLVSHCYRYICSDDDSARFLTQYATGKDIMVYMYVYVILIVYFCVSDKIRDAVLVAK